MTTYDPERYRLQPGAIPLRSLNLPPHEGERLVGYVPFGVTAVTGPNMGGKSRLLSAVQAIPLRVAQPGQIDPTRGHQRAGVQFGAAELRIEDVDGDRTVERETPESEGTIGRLPDPIEIMVTGGDHLDPEVNLRHRIRAVNDFAPVEVTEERLHAVAGDAMPDEELGRWLVGQHRSRQFDTLLAAADALAGRRGELNDRALAAEKDAENKRDTLNRRAGALDEVLLSAGRRAGIIPEDGELKDYREAVERELAADDPALESAAADLRTAESQLARLEQRVESATEERERRRQLRESHGAAPEVAHLQEAREKARRRKVALAALVEEEAEALNQKLGARREMVDAGDKVRERLREGLRTVRDAAGDAISTLDPEVEVNVDHIRMRVNPIGPQHKANIETLVELAEISGRIEVWDREVQGTEEKLANHRRSLEEANTALDQAASSLTAGEAALERWRKVEAELATDIEAPTEQQLNQAREEVDHRRRRAALATDQQAYRDARERYEATEIDHRTTAARAAGLREQVPLTWHRLGDVLTDALGSDLIRFRDGAIEIKHDDGTWYDVADNVQLSKGRLRRAFLDFFLERSAEGVNIVVPEEIMLLVDGPGRREISARAAAKRIRMLFELPDESGTVTEPELAWYGAGGEPT